MGFANGNTIAPTYEQMKNENTGHAETVRVTYDPESLPLKILLKLFYKIIDPKHMDWWKMYQGGRKGRYV